MTETLTLLLAAVAPVITIEMLRFLLKRGESTANITSILTSASTNLLERQEAVILRLEIERNVLLDYINKLITTLQDNHIKVPSRNKGEKDG